MLSISTVVPMLGPRQCGKTTIARTFSKNRTCEYFDLEDPADIEWIEFATFVYS